MKLLSLNVCIRIAIVDLLKLRDAFVGGSPGTNWSLSWRFKSGSDHQHKCKADPITQS